MTYVYCPHRSNGAFELVKALDAHRLRKFDGMDFWDKRKRYTLNPGDVIICWGATIPELDDVRVLNSLEQPLGPFKEWEKLMNMSVPTISIGRGKPVPSTLVPRLQRILTAVDPLYYIQKENFTAEYRIHSFDKRSIRAGVKVPREGFTVCSENEWQVDSNLAHPWVKSFLGGWKVDYDFKSTSELRKLAHVAVKTLGLTFGAVDIGMRADGKLKVLEVDRAPRIEGGTVASYTRAITRWIKEGEKDDTGGIPVGEPVEDVDYDPGE